MIIDWKAAMENVGDDPDLLHLIMTEAVKETPKLFENLKVAISEGDAKVAGRLAHTIKGSSVSVGAVEMKGTASAVEESAHSGDLEVSLSQLPVLEQSIESFIAEFKKFNQDGKFTPPTSP